MKTEITISNRTIIRVVIIVVLSMLGVALAVRLQTQLVWIITALFFALALDPAVRKVSRYMPKQSRALAVLCVFIIVAAVIGLALYTLVPLFASQMYKLVDDLPKTYQQFKTTDPRLANDLANAFHFPQSASAIASWSAQLLNYGGSAIGIVKSIFGGIIALVTIILLSVFMVLEGPHWMDIFWRYAPANKRNQWQPLVGQMHGTITGYVNGNLIKSLIAALATAIMLLIVGSPDVLALSLLIAIFDLIPMVGATLGAVLVSLVVLVLIGGSAALVMAIFFLIFQQIENNVLQPLIFSHTVEVSPLVTILALIIGASLAGFVGALVAIPVAASAQILARTYVRGRFEHKKA